MSQTEQAQPSGNSRPISKGSRFETVGERWEPDPPATAQAPTPSPIEKLMEANRPKTTTSTTPPNPFQQEFMHRSVWKAGVLGSLNALALVLAARLIVLVAVGGAIALTFAALGHSDSLSVQILLGVYAICAVLISWIVTRK